MSTETQVQELVRKARIAQQKFESFSQEQVDAIVKGIGKYVYDNAESLSKLAVEETGLGNYEDKVQKKKGKSRAIWNSLKGKKSRGILSEDPETGLTYMAKPMGVIGAVTPVTNPVVTPMCNAMFALKCGNAIIIASHPKGQKSANRLEEAFMAVVKANGGPDNLIQVVKNGSIETTQELMKSVDAVVATGGPGMVKSAYSSGKPSYGVGAGNVPVVIDRGVNLAETCARIQAGAAFDNGIICSHEQFVFVPREQYQDAVKAFLATGKVWYSEDETVIEKFRNIVFPGGQLGKDVVGVSCTKLGKLAGIEIPETVKTILLKVKGSGTADVLAKEKLTPVVAIFPYDTFEEAVAGAKANLIVEGAGHTAAIHSNDEAHIHTMGLALPISRLVVNQPASTSAGGGLNNGFAPTTTLGCGSWGGNSISENLDFKHLMNVSRIGRIIPGKKIPTDAEIWA